MTTTANTVPIPSTSGPAPGRLLAAPAPDYPTHLRTHGALPRLSGPQVLEQVRLSRLTGRGGAAFATIVKLGAVAARGRAVVVGNGAEGEPASRKDLQLLLSAPHLVLDGLQLAALATGAREAFVYLRADAVAAVRYALQERAAAGIDRTPVTIVEAAPGFVAGQETAVVARLNGGPALPRFARTRVSERGVGGRPTLVQNVETLGHLALIARHGGWWFGELGGRSEADAAGTFLATVTGRDGARRVWEVPHGLPLGQLLTAAAGQPVEELQAVLVGGYHGSWLPLPAALAAPLSPAGLAPFGGSLGAGVVLPLATASCGLAATAGIVRYLAAESAKQCGPCQFGLPHLADLMSALADAGRQATSRSSTPGMGAASGSAGASGSGALVSGVSPPGASGVDSISRAIRQAVGLVEGRGACHHPDGTARLVRSALRTFERDVVMHSHGRCLARIAQPYGGI
jgi:NADH:ubiquinone oxidoreductase subunit F (NADH-binding)